MCYQTLKTYKYNSGRKTSYLAFSEKWYSLNYPSLELSVVNVIMGQYKKHKKKFFFAIENKALIKYLEVSYLDTYYIHIIMFEKHNARFKFPLFVLTKISSISCDFSSNVCI